MSTYKIAVLVGSLRQESYNRQVAKALIKLMPAHFQAEIVEIGQLPLYNQDADANVSAGVMAFKNTIAAADAVLVVTPEYNRGIPAPLKNALDQGSRPWGQNSWQGKPAGLVGVSTGNIGTALAQQQLRGVFAFLDMRPLNQPEMFIKWEDGMVDAQGVFNDRTGKFMGKWVSAFVAWVETQAGK
ncbi:MAG: NAD(P)H-dependent oxidoreductase [Neisseriaceae bacterium]|nr:NAD(P)H-dependent oxidoreductase [Neisseriaceae bacterium]MBP6861733.1 NAD(P)H-dependent oxidoreductase [Neisseriaceae bacterium]